LVNAWYGTPTKWYPLPLGVGALLLVGLQWRKRKNDDDKKEVTLEHGEEVVRLKGPWQVSLPFIPRATGIRDRTMWPAYDRLTVAINVYVLLSAHFQSVARTRLLKLSVEAGAV